MCFWGLLVLAPVYSTAGVEGEWARTTLSNITSTSSSRDSGLLWIAAIFCYAFTAYFCQLLYAEYNNFSVRRLQYLVQV